MSKRSEPEDGRVEYTPTDPNDAQNAAKIRKIESQDHPLPTQTTTNTRPVSYKEDSSPKEDTESQNIQPMEVQQNTTTLPTVESQEQIAQKVETTQSTPPTVANPTENVSPQAEKPQTTATSNGLQTNNINNNNNNNNNNSGTPLTAQGVPTEDGTGEKYNKQKHAMDFLLKVRHHYASSPSVYNEFLEIMKEFKSANIDTPDVIQRVKELFKGHNHLVMEFNSFLPPGYKIELDPEPVVTTPTTTPIATPTTPPVVTPASVATQQPTSNANSTPAAPPAAQAASQADLEHARNYVRKIKNRFALQPQIYKQFLEILHGYYQGQHQINEVLEEVGELFQTHSDLLEEFKLFLPRSVADNGAAPIKTKPKTVKTNKSKPEKEERDTRERERERRGASDRKKQIVHIPDERRTLPPREKRPVFEEDRFRKRENVVSRDSMTRYRDDEPAIARKIPKQPSNWKNPAQEYGFYTEYTFFTAVKERLNNNLLFHEFLKCINLYSLNILSKSELIQLVNVLLKQHKDLYDNFKLFIGLDDKEIQNLETDNKIKNLSIPSDVIIESINDIDSSVQFEEEKFELEIMIDMSNSTMKALQNIVDLAERTETPPAPETLDILHIRNIERIYGDRSNDILEYLYTKPDAAIPVIQKRLRQKNQEWTLTRKELIKTHLANTTTAAATTSTTTPTAGTTNGNELQSNHIGSQQEIEVK